MQELADTWKRIQYTKNQLQLDELYELLQNTSTYTDLEEHIDDFLNRQGKIACLLQKLQMYLYEQEQEALALRAVIKEIVDNA